jgi:hypothetical protein
MDVTNDDPQKQQQQQQDLWIQPVSKESIAVPMSSMTESRLIEQQQQRFSIASSEPSSWSRLFDLRRQQDVNKSRINTTPKWLLNEINAIKIKIDRA